MESCFALQSHLLQHSEGLLETAGTLVAVDIVLPLVAQHKQNIEQLLLRTATDRDQRHWQQGLVTNRLLFPDQHTRQ